MNPLMFVLINIDAGLNAVKALRRCRPNGGDTNPAFSASLEAINRELIERGEAVNAAQRVVLDMDSTEIPVYGQQEHGAYDGHFESTLHRLLGSKTRLAIAFGGGQVYVVGRGGVDNGNSG